LLFEHRRVLLVAVALLSSVVGHSQLPEPGLIQESRLSQIRGT
jgi:hypothetical protein